MFSGLSQGSSIYILEKNNGLQFKIGEVIGVTQPNQFGGMNTNFINPAVPIIIKAKVDNEVREYPDVPSSQTIMSYNNGNLIISETPQGIQNEVESIHKRDKQILSSIPNIKKEVEDCEKIMEELSPSFKQDKARDQKITELDSKVTSIEGKLDKILNAISNK